VQPVADRKAVLLRLDPKVHAAVRRWAIARRRSFNAQVEHSLHRALINAGRLRCTAEKQGDAKRDR
jgi:hypothetical protein